ncbi:hypothetical protein ONZ43_g6483 [Nemania bipapillata]|uniref:Uncharacterized protein n=1 Tax=Nemania bipapillata TaxID=110536 RepID=A0ACC2HYU1_9PEZI|nr:hypothetical protein ONZ43_g6483 [Nemania bipapillata]
MGLVDYSDSESETEVVTKPAPSAQQLTAGSSKKPFQKVVDRSKPGKIRVNLPGSSSQDDVNTATNGDEPPAKRARTLKGGAFSGFNSFLPAPKNVGKKSAPSTSSTGGGDKGINAPRPGVHLKTGAAPGFVRNTDEHIGDEKTTSSNDGGMDLPAPKSQQPTIPAGQKPADEVKLVGKPLMFRPLSVSRKKPTKKGTTKYTTAASVNLESTATTATTATPTTTTPASTTPTPQTAPAKINPPPKKKISLFSISDEQSREPEPKDESNNSYEPLINTDDALETSAADDFAAYDAHI